MTSERSSAVGRLSRRTLLSTTAAATGAFALPGCDYPAVLTRLPTDLPLVDAHAHIINAKDLPAFSFLNEVYLQHYATILLQPLGLPLKALADAIIDESPGFREEMLALHSTAPPRTPVDVYANILLDWATKDRGALGDETRAQFDKHVPVASDKTNVHDLARAKELARKLLRPKDETGLEADDGFLQPVRQALLWFGTFTRYRRDLINDWHAFVGKDGPRFMMPAVNDFTYSLRGERGPVVSIPNQVHLLGALSRVQPARRLMHGYVSFNPVRWSLNQAEKVEAEATFQDAFDNQGFIGVKLYPPMGYRVSDNMNADMSLFSGMVGNTRTLGAEIDKGLEWAFEQCKKYDATVLVHTSPSQNPHNNPHDTGNWFERPNPKHWKAVLERYPKMRVLLSHFGGAQNIHIEQPNQEWAAQILALLKADNNVYVDIADYHLVLEDSVTQRRQRLLLFEWLTKKRSAEERDLLSKRLVFGTDFPFINLGGGAADYTGKMLDFMRQTLGGDVQDYAGRNALRMIGLDDDDSKATKRLWQFHSSTGNRETLKQFISLVNPRSRYLTMS